MERNMNDQAVAAKSSEFKREVFIKDMERTILKFASRVTGRFVTKSDDEWSIALFAFNKAIDTYSEDKGDYLAYSKVLINRALIDYKRSESRHSAEVLYDPEVLEGEEAGPIYEILTRESTDTEEKKLVNTDLKEEIEEINNRLRTYGFSFFDVAGSSPKSIKTRAACGKAILQIADDKELLESVLKDGKLPIKQISDEQKISRFTIDRHRRYILTGVIILAGDYPLISDYLQYLRKDQ
ncbi:MAG: hypothetical protein J5367_06685 [Lachnospiraceae bacterium]|nr:hypothetical protein [Lachnospiraceae bacterium]